MHPPLTTDRQRYHHLYSLVCEDFPTGIVDVMLRDGHPATVSQLTMVRNGRKPHLHWLIDLVATGMPHFRIPEELRPSTAATPLFV